VPARGFANRTRAALGTRPAGTTTGPRGARCPGWRRLRSLPIPWSAGPGLSQASKPGERRGGAPRGERARSAGKR